MIGWENTCSRDYEELVLNGHVDTDLERMAATIEFRRRQKRLADMDPFELRRAVEIIVSSDRLPAEELRQIVSDYGEGLVDA